MKKSKFKVGDTVKIKSREWVKAESAKYKTASSHDTTEYYLINEKRNARTYMWPHERLYLGDVRTIRQVKYNSYYKEYSYAFNNRVDAVRLPETLLEDAIKFKLKLLDE